MLSPFYIALNSDCFVAIDWSIKTLKKIKNGGLIIYVQRKCIN